AARSREARGGHDAIRAGARRAAIGTAGGAGAMMSAALVLASWLFPSRRSAGLEPVTLRRIRADDAAALQSLVRLLSPRSRRFRFHGAVNELSAATLDEFTRVDQCRHVAFVLTVTEHGAERIVGEARY